MTALPIRVVPHYLLELRNIMVLVTRSFESAVKTKYILSVVIIEFYELIKT